MLDLILFVVISAGSGWLVWRPAASSRLYRFLSLELLLVLALLTRERWFADPLSRPQVISWFLLAAGLALILLALVRRPSSLAPDPAAPGEAAEKIGNNAGNNADGDTGAALLFPPPRGIYKTVRHPVYAAALFVGWGLFAKTLTPFDNAALLYALLLTGVSLFLVSAARADETADYLKFGAPFARYVKASKMLIPFIL